MYKKGEIYMVDFGTLDSTIGSEQGGLRPACIVSNNIGNSHASVVIVAPITSKDRPMLPTHVYIEPDDTGIKKASYIKCEQMRAIDKTRISRYVAHLSDSLMAELDGALKSALAIGG